MKKAMRMFFLTGWDNIDPDEQQAASITAEGFSTRHWFWRGGGGGGSTRGIKQHCCLELCMVLGCGLAPLELGFCEVLHCMQFHSCKECSRRSLCVLLTWNCQSGKSKFSHKDPAAVPDTWDHVWSHIKLKMTFSGHYTLVHENQLFIIFPMV